jgi:hypothetical protein
MDDGLRCYQNESPCDRRMHEMERKFRRVEVHLIVDLILISQ